MARSKGSANLAASLEVLAGAPLDAREKVATKADLTASGSFPYFYVGMEVYVEAENKKYRFIGSDPTDIEDWEEIGSGGGGHEIEDSEGTALTQRETMQFGDGFNATDDSENEKTVVEPNLMTAADMDDVVTPLPSVRSGYHKYSTEEQVVGEWIDGTTLYEKTLQITMPSANESSISTGVENGNHARIVDGFIEQTGSSDGNYSFPIMFDSGSPLTTKVLIQVTVNGSHLYVYSNFDKTDGKTAYITIQYTKTTD